VVHIITELLQGYCTAVEKQAKAPVYDASNDPAVCNDLSDVNVQVQSTEEVRARTAICIYLRIRKLQLLIVRKCARVRLVVYLTDTIRDSYYSSAEFSRSQLMRRTCYDSSSTW
jgi:hypothetical protein